jgi:hypothetical protein
MWMKLERFTRKTQGVKIFRTQLCVILSFFAKNRDCGTINLASALKPVLSERRTCLVHVGIVGRLICSLQRAAPFGLPVCIARLPPSPLCETLG